MALKSIIYLQTPLGVVGDGEAVRGHRDDLHYSILMELQQQLQPPLRWTTLPVRFSYCFVDARKIYAEGERRKSRADRRPFVESPRVGLEKYRHLNSLTNFCQA